MAGKIGGASLDLDKAGLIPELLKEGHAFSFFQVLRLLRRYGAKLSDESSSDPHGADQIVIKPNLSLAFPPSDVKAVEESMIHDQTCFVVTANFLGLYGTASPLPTFYTEDLMDEEAQDESVARDFFDFVNQPLFALLYRTWCKYRLHLNVLEEENPRQIEQLFCLLGLGEKPVRQTITTPYRLLRYIGLFTQYPRSALGLKTLLQDALGGIAVTVVQCVHRKAKIPESQRLRTGMSGSKLGVDSIVGETIDDRMGKFRIQLGPLTRAEFHHLVPGQEAFDWLVLLTGLYFVEPLEYDVEVIMAEAEVQSVLLGDDTRSILGIDTWIFSSDTWGEVSAAFDPDPN
ncbi:MAG: type VI secretion system baseplate subunit TssG [Desulfobacterales bacterium]|nr:type VI secretion system baseplate subunit TssG [Desulfobacterales bacterium]